MVVRREPSPPPARRLRQSMSAVGSSADNAAAESFNATFKRQSLQGRRAFTVEREARLTAFRWLHRYNTVRRHSRLGQQSPITTRRTSGQPRLRWPRPHKPRVQDQGSSPEFMEALGWAPQPDLASVRVSPAYAQAVMEALRNRRITRARALELMHGHTAEADLPQDDDLEIAP
ncbi:integrase core domain-containing protein [Micromonospora sp. MP36]|uniref:integrase core domain-containing protein n=1 Tax=unclassified Micromonospora TaxID=2617518 RepID=UPI00351B8175